MAIFTVTYTYRPASATKPSIVTSSVEADNLRHALLIVERALSEEHIVPMNASGASGTPILSVGVIAVKVSPPAPSKANILDRPDVKAVADAVHNYNKSLGSGSRRARF